MHNISGYFPCQHGRWHGNKDSTITNIPMDSTLPLHKECNLSFYYSMDISHFVAKFLGAFIYESIPKTRIIREILKEIYE